MVKLTEQESTALLMSLGRGGKSFTEEQGNTLLDWAINIKIDYAILQAVFSGQIRVGFAGGSVNGELQFYPVETKKV